jgi:hypothetical protein
VSDLHYFHPDWIVRTDRQLKTDICVYGGTSAGVIAAIKARKLGKQVVLLHPGKHVGGLTTGGLGWTDYGQKQVIGGLSREFYNRCGAAYGKEEEFRFEPHVATAVYEKWLSEHAVPVELGQYLDKVEMSGGRITAITLLGGLRVEAAAFIDATYEGDLMAGAGVSFTVGREGNAAYQETLNGIQVREYHQFSHPVDPFVKEGDEGSGLLPFIVEEDLSRKQGMGDKRVQAYCFRMCMTDDPALRIAWERPERYDPALYVLARRWFRGQKDEYNDQLTPERAQEPGAVPRKFDILPMRTAGGFHKTDTNNHGPVSSDFIGANHDWPTASYARREEIFQAHVAYQKGYYWFMANDPTILERYRAAYQRWGLPKDEFQSTGHWPHSIYVREGRRMVADYVITEHDCRGQRTAPDAVGMGSYAMDSHNCSRFVARGTGKPHVMNDGDVQVHVPPYAISYRAIVPRAGECANLLVPVCLSTSHIAYGSARMEPVFMVLGESAAIAANLAMESGQAVQGVDQKKLHEALVKAGQVLAVAK